jgi:hypothetical protein
MCHAPRRSESACRRAIQLGAGEETGTAARGVTRSTACDQHHSILQQRRRLPEPPRRQDTRYAEGL